MLDHLGKDGLHLRPRETMEPRCQRIDMSNEQ